MLTKNIHYVELNSSPMFTIDDAKKHISKLRRAYLNSELSQTPLIAEDGDAPYDLQNPRLDKRLRTKFAYYENMNLSLMSKVSGVLRGKQEVTEILSQLNLEYNILSSELSLNEDIADKYPSQKKQEAYIINTYKALYLIREMYNNLKAELEIEYTNIVEAQNYLSRALTAAELDARARGIV